VVLCAISFFSAVKHFKPKKHMISVYNIKPKFQQLLKPLLQGLYRMGVTANHLTIVAILLSALLGSLMIIIESRIVYMVVALGLLLRMALNALDGMMARTYNMQSKTGEILNELGDVVSDIFIYLPMITWPGLNIYVVIAFVLLGVINEFAGLLAKVVGGERRYDGPMGKSDRALLFGLICLIKFFWNGINTYMNYIFLISLVLLLISTYSRLKNSKNK
jgi:CDP-diacylglycerol--glycerol-3-phosphate 3-phosphatidyltransferase